MLAFKGVPRFFVIEGFDIPLDQWKIFPVVLGVTAGALLTGTGRDVVSRMQTTSRRKPRGNFCVTVKTLQRGLPAEFMASGTVRRSV